MRRSMSARQTWRRIGRWCGWLAVVLVLGTFLTGYGISNFRIVTPWTLGFLNKVRAHTWHHYTDLPLLLVLITHVAIALYMRLCGARRKGQRTNKEI